MKDKQYIRANLDVIWTPCKVCGQRIEKNNINQIVYFCSKKCRKDNGIKTIERG